MAIKAEVLKTLNELSEKEKNLISDIKITNEFYQNEGSKPRQIMISGIQINIGLDKIKCKELIGNITIFLELELEKVQKELSQYIISKEA